MRVILIFFMFLSSAVRCISQESQFYSPSKKEKLSTEAYEVFRANKFLNFKDKDSLIENIEDSVYKKTNLNTFFQHKKDWEKIQKEDTASYAKKDNAKYAYKNNTMIETYLEFGSYNVRKEIKKVCNPKSFVLLHEKKYFVGENYNRTESIVNEYDNQNRVIKIIKRTEYSKKENNEESIITVKYENNTVTISSKNGTIVCEFIGVQSPSKSLVQDKSEDREGVKTTNSKTDSWSGKYFFKRKNKDELETSFSIKIKNLNDIAIIYIGDGEKAESYKNLKAEDIADDKIKIAFNKEYDELGIIYIQKNDIQYVISGEPISNINPGNDEYPLKKMD